MASKNLMKVLELPSKVASTLDWKKAGGAVLTLNVHSDRIGLSIAHHPSHGDTSHKKYESLPLEKKGRIIPESTRQRLADLVVEQNVCAFVVSWPVQNDTGNLGYAAGHTLYIIEQLLQDNNKSKTSVITSNRPLCLWDGSHKAQPPKDSFGRCSVYARTSNQTCHLASEQQYHEDENRVAALVWEDFVKTNWPTIYQAKQQEAKRLVQRNEHQNSETQNASRMGSAYAQREVRGDQWDDMPNGCDGLVAVA